MYNIYWLGLTIVLGGQFIYWNLGFHEGFWEFFLTTVMVGSGYLCLTLCLAEMTSILPFAGGSYGYVRCTLGPALGFLVGCCEAMEYVLYVATALAEFGQLVSISTHFPSAYEPLYWMLFYLVALSVHLRGGAVFWRTSDLLAVCTLLLVVLSLLSATTVGNFERYASDAEAFEGDGYRFFLYFPLASWFFVGVEAMTLTCEHVSDPSTHVPHAMVACILTLLTSAFCILFATGSVSPGAEAIYKDLLPLNRAYEQAWQIASSAATILALPGIFSTAFGFMFAYGRQILAMSRSKLLPAFLSQTSGPQHTPVAALTFGSLFGLSVLLALYYTFPSFSRELFSICMLGSCSVYVSIFRSYLICAQRYRNLQRQFTSPLGVYGAYYGMCVFSLMVISLAFFQDSYLSLIAFSTFVVVALVYYYSYVRKMEFLSEEEQRNFWKAYLLNASSRRKAHNKKTFLRILPHNASAAAAAPGTLHGAPMRTPSGGRVNPYEGEGEEYLSQQSEAVDKVRRLFRFSDPPPPMVPGGAMHTPYEEKDSGTATNHSVSSDPLELHFDWGGERIVLTETATVCIFAATRIAPVSR